MKNQLTNEDVEYRKTIHIRNLKRKLSKLRSYPILTDEYFELKKEIETLEKELE